MRTYALLASVLVVSAASADLLFDNGEFITKPGLPAWSECPANRNTAGSNANRRLGGAVADGFTVPPGTHWRPGQLEWYAYQTGSSTESTFTAAYVELYDGSPAGGANVIWGDMTTNRLISSVWSGVYRCFNGGIGNTERPVMKTAIDLAGSPLLGPGRYYLAVSFDGSLASGPWANYTEPPAAGDNGEQLWGGHWMIQNVNGFGVDYPFKLGPPEPATFLLFGMCVLLRRR